MLVNMQLVVYVLLLISYSMKVKPAFHCYHALDGIKEAL